MATYRIYIYLLISVCVFVHTSFFPQRLAHLLMSMFEPTADGRAIITSPSDLVQYYNMVVYGGLAVAGALFLEALRLTVRRFVRGKGAMGGAIDLVFRLLTVALVFLCTVAVYHLFRGEKAGLFSLSQEAVVTLMVLLLCLAGDCLRRHMRHGKRGGSDA